MASQVGPATKTVEQHDVIIVGAGPVGLSLALGLARAGVDVVVLEKNGGVADHSRAPAIWPGTQEIFSRLGVFEQFRNNGILLSRIELVDHDRQKIILRLPIEELQDETSHPQLLIVPQSTTERLLCTTLMSETDADVRFSSEAIRIRQSSSRVELTYRHEQNEEQIFARFVVGCDGARSMVRDAIGSSFDGMTYGTQAALADVVVPNTGTFPFPRMTTRPSLAVAIRIDTDLWRLILPFSGDDERGMKERIEDAMNNLFPPIEYETVWNSEFRLHRRMSSSWVDGRLVLAGDAAHLNSPVGGQGMNAGIIDADFLSSALREALENDSTEPLTRYAAQRRSEVEKGVNRFTNRMTRVLLAKNGRFVRPAMRLINLLLHISPLRRRIVRRLAMLNDIAR